ncbi:hypothetical protein PG991_002374 [Apiospora marii]|uniref:RING-type domain-containing protein n=2 Tax=Apiospora marii TaxID=335849 RepID=A0ABR1SGG6_9PEZI
MAGYIKKPSTSTPLQRLDPNTKLRAQPQPRPQLQPQAKMRAVHGSRTYHEVPHPNQETPPRTQQCPSMTGFHERQAAAHDVILNTIPPGPKAVSANRTPKLKIQTQAHHHHQPQQKEPPQQKRQQQKQRPPPLDPITIPPLVPSFESPAYHQDLPQRPKQRPTQPPPPPPLKRPRPKTQYDKPPAGPAWKLRERRLQEQRQKHKRRPTYGLRKPAATAEEDEERARADSETLGPQTTCPGCQKHRPTFSELIEAYGFCFYCLRRHLVAAGELLKCPSCRRLQARQDFMKYDNDGLVVEERTAECMECQWRHKRGTKLSAALCGGLT